MNGFFYNTSFPECWKHPGKFCLVFFRTFFSLPVRSEVFGLAQDCVGGDCHHDNGPITRDDPLFACGREEEERRVSLYIYIICTACLLFIDGYDFVDDFVGFLAVKKK